MESREQPLFVIPGLLMIVALPIAAIADLIMLTNNSDSGHSALNALLIAIFAALLVSIRGFTIVQPNTALVATFLGHYAGTLRKRGFWWINPLTQRRSLSLRINNLDSEALKVNDAAGNPVEIAAVINWQVKDTARAVFDIENYNYFVHIQAETAVRHVASEFPYDTYEEGKLSLRGNSGEVAETLKAELQQQLSVAGIRVLDTRLRRLAYAPEIAGEMLRRQQADAVVAARERIVDGAVGMVDAALRKLEDEKIVVLDDQQKAALVSNLLVVLVSDHGSQPVVNTGLSSY